MKKSINLISQKKSTDSVLKNVYYATVSVFVVTVVISLSLIAYRLVLKSSFDTLESKEKQINSKLLTLVEKRDKVIETKTRLSEVRKIISKGAPITSRIETITQLLPNNSQVNSISGSDASIQMTLESDNLSSLNELIEQKVNEIATDKKRGIKKVEMRSFGLNPKTSKYTITFGIEFI